MHTDYVSESEIMSEAPLGLGRETTQSSCYLQDMGFEMKMSMWYFIMFSIIQIQHMFQALEVKFCLSLLIYRSQYNPTYQ